MREQKFYFRFVFNMLNCIGVGWIGFFSVEIPPAAEIVPPAHAAAFRKSPAFFPTTCFFEFFVDFRYIC